jgi:hypothetical protein
MVDVSVRIGAGVHPCSGPRFISGELMDAGGNALGKA